jgi:hypothetical protein
MVSRKNKLGVVVLGQCSGCEQMFEMSKDHGSGFSGIADHLGPDGEPCRGIGYSVRKEIYTVENDEQARMLAEVIANDNNTCLSDGIGHSRACGDGKYCSEERRLRAHALANYYLSLGA